MLNPVTSKETVTESNTVDETGNNNTIDSSVNVFNNGNSAMTRNSKEIPQGTDKRHARRQVLRTVFRLSVRTIEIIQKEMNLRKTNFKAQVVTEIAKEISLDIY